MSKDLRAEIAELRAEVAQLRAMAGQIPVRFGNSGGPIAAGTYANPKPIGAADVHTEYADTQTWDRGNQGAYDGAIVYLLSGWAYDPASDQLIYVFVRPATIDNQGKIAVIGAEVRLLGETPVEGCTA